jgi:hypothetical protein
VLLRLLALARAPGELAEAEVAETGEWEIIGRPYTTAGGKTARVRV